MTVTGTGQWMRNPNGSNTAFNLPGALLTLSSAQTIVDGYQSIAYDGSTDPLGIVSGSTIVVPSTYGGWWWEISGAIGSIAPGLPTTDSGIVFNVAINGVVSSVGFASCGVLGSVSGAVSPQAAPLAITPFLLQLSTGDVITGSIFTDINGDGGSLFIAGAGGVWLYAKPIAPV